MNFPSAPLRARAPEGSSAPTGAPLFIGADLGKVTTSLAVGELGDDGQLRVLETRAERHLGDPLRPFLELYRELDAGRLAGIAATGVYGERLGEPAVGGVPEEIAQEQAAAWLYPDGPLNVVRVGGGGYSVLTRDAAGSSATRATSAARPAPERPSRACAPVSAARSRRPSRSRRRARTASPSPAAAPCSPRAS